MEFLFYAPARQTIGIILRLYGNFGDEKSNSTLFVSTTIDQHTFLVLNTISYYYFISITFIILFGLYKGFW